MNIKYLCAVSFATVVYTILGGVIFHYIEKNDEEKARREAPEIHSKWLGKQVCTHTYIHSQDDEL